MASDANDDRQEFATLLAAARTGDDEALGQLARLYEPALRIVARARLGPALRPYLDSLDLVQSVHRSLLVGVRDARFDVSSPDHLTALALRMVQRKVARKWRKAKRQQRLSRDLGSDWPAAQMVAELSTPDADPASIVANRDAIEAILSRCSEKERRLVELRLAGCTTAESAKRLDIAPNYARVLLGRLRKRLSQFGAVVELL